MTAKTRRLTAVPTTAAGGDSDGISRRAELADLATHPDNPRGTDLGDVTELAASIGSHGVLEPLVVITREAFAAAHPDLPIANDSAGFVIVAGHRRHAAAQLAAAADVPVIVRDDLAAGGRDVEVMLAENLHRENLTPMQEARAFAQLRDLGRSQRQIAASVGCGQSHVSKRLALLELPAGGQQAIEDGRIGPAAAEELLRLRDHPDVLNELVTTIVDDLPDPSNDPDRQDINGPLGADDVAYDVEDALREIRARELIEGHRKTLAEQGIPVAEPAELRTQLGVTSLIDQEIYPEDTDRFEAEKNAGTLVATVTPRGGIDYYTTTKFEPNKNHPATNYRAKEVEEEKQRTRAMKARAQACVRLVKTVPAKDTVIAALVQTVICRHIDVTALDLACQWLTELGVLTADQLDHDATVQTIRSTSYHVEKMLAASDDTKLRTHVAYAMAIAAQENRTRFAYRSWDAADAAYLQLLIDKAGYHPTDWEQARLDAIGTEPDDAELEDEDLVDDEEAE